ncbi:hypothetical protein SAMN05216215_108111 [Saccharopolyspora shandongensis]|uniref:Uncharacterized protein n=1 Tax=Saccharopolyspora shandongensis TaxID=418495 RepID=A0A1H3TF68_9PSEU|nr:hypothetical protein SAMN05216215_108111 [Saccharopolyspora shandongensis]
MSCGEPLPDRKATTVEAWLREHSDVRMVRRDGSATYAEGCGARRAKRP